MENLDAAPEHRRAQHRLMAVWQPGQPLKRQNFPDLERTETEQPGTGQTEQQEFLGMLCLARHNRGALAKQKLP